jgi:hypothetical protein
MLHSRAWTCDEGRHGWVLRGFWGSWGDYRYLWCSGPHVDTKHRRCPTTITPKPDRIMTIACRIKRLTDVAVPQPPSRDIPRTPCCIMLNGSITASPTRKYRHTWWTDHNMTILRWICTHACGPWLISNVTSNNLPPVRSIQFGNHRFHDDKGNITWDERTCSSLLWLDVISLNNRAASKKERERRTRGGNSFRVFELFIIISNPYETFKSFYDVVFNNTFRNRKMNRIQWHKFFFYYNFC